MNPVGVVVREIQREFDVDGVLIGLLERLESLPHVLDEPGLGEQVVERRHPDLAGAAGRRGKRFVGRGEHLHRHIGALFDHVEEVARHDAVGLKIDVIDPPLGVLADLLEVGFGPFLRHVERDEPGVVVVGAVHRPRPQAEDQPEHARLGIDALIPDVGIEGEPHAGRLRVIVPAVHLARRPASPAGPSARRG